MPSADRYSKYRADQTTVWISKNAADFMARERAGGEGTAAVLDRLVTELKKHRRANPSLAPERPAAKSATKKTAKTASKRSAQPSSGTAAKGAAKSAGKSAAKGAGKTAAKGAAKTATKRAVRTGAKRAASRSA